MHPRQDLPALKATGESEKDEQPQPCISQSLQRILKATLLLIGQTYVKSLEKPDDLATAIVLDQSFSNYQAIKNIQNEISTNTSGAEKITWPSQEATGKDEQKWLEETDNKDDEHL